MIKRPLPPEVKVFHTLGLLIADVADIVCDIAEQLEPARGGVNAQALENIHGRAVLLANSLRKIAEEAK